jgi:hypothetical protein
MLALASTRLGYGLTSIVFAVVTAGAFLALSRIGKLPADKAKLKRVRVAAWMLYIVMFFTLPAALESLARIWDPTYVYNGS